MPTPACVSMQMARPHLRPTGDETGMNSICIYCSTGGDSDGTYYCQPYGHYGEWGYKKSCCSGKGGMVGYRILSEPSNGDDTAAGGVQTFCADGTKCEAPHTVVYSDSVRDCNLPLSPSFSRAAVTAGPSPCPQSWSAWKRCPQGQAICGVIARQEAAMYSGGDDTETNDVKFKCCYWHDARNSVSASSMPTTEVCASCMYHARTRIKRPRGRDICVTVPAADGTGGG